MNAEPGGTEKPPGFKRLIQDRVSQFAIYFPQEAGNVCLASSECDIMPRHLVSQILSGRILRWYP